MTDFQVEVLFRDITEEEAIQKSNELLDYYTMSAAKEEFEIFVMEVYIEDDEHGMRSVHHWPEDAKGPFKDIVWTDEES